MKLSKSIYLCFVNMTITNEKIMTTNEQRIKKIEKLIARLQNLKSMYADINAPVQSINEQITNFEAELKELKEVVKPISENALTINGVTIEPKLKLSDWQKEQLAKGQARVYSSAAQVGKIVREYIKAKWPNVKTKRWVQTETYAGGDSLRLYFDGLEENVYKVISKEIEALFQGGSFNGMEDIYEHDTKEVDYKGGKLEHTVKYVFTSNKAPY